MRKEFSFALDQIGAMDMFERLAIVEEDMMQFQVDRYQKLREVGTPVPQTTSIPQFDSALLDRFRS